jgi:hypothetical protein
MAIRTSGDGARDSLMTIVPLAMLIVFAVYMLGGPTATLKWFEQTLQGVYDWAMTIV